MTRRCYDKTLLSLGGSGGMPPPPRKIFKFKTFRLHFRTILTKIRVDMEALQFVNSLQLALLLVLNFLAGEGDLVLGGTSQGSPLFRTVPSSLGGGGDICPFPPPV